MANQSSPTVEEMQLRKRARRRLVGAVALVVVMVALLPMVLDDEPKPMGSDIAINIPSQQSTDFPAKSAPPPAAPLPPPPPPQTQLPLQGEKRDTPPPPSPALEPKTSTPAPAAPRKEKQAKSGEHDKPTKPLRHDESPAAKTRPTPEVPKPAESQPKPAHSAAPVHIVLLGAFSSETNAKQRQAKLKELGVKYYVEKIKSPAGEKTAVRAGPYPSRQEAEQVLTKLKAAGIRDGIVTERK